MFYFRCKKSKSQKIKKTDNIKDQKIPIKIKEEKIEASASSSVLFKTKPAKTSNIFTTNTAGTSKTNAVQNTSVLKTKCQVQHKKQQKKGTTKNNTTSECKNRSTNSHNPIKSALILPKEKANKLRKGKNSLLNGTPKSVRFLQSNRSDHKSHVMKPAELNKHQRANHYPNILGIINQNNHENVQENFINSNCGKIMLMSIFVPLYLYILQYLANL